MWFKNLQIYRLPTPWNIDLAKFDELLSRAPFNRCPSNEPLSTRLDFAAP
jgi:recombination associated protein RdgC